MNEIEEMFYESFKEYVKIFEDNLLTPDKRFDVFFKPQYCFGGYILDFVFDITFYNEVPFRFCIEIDGQESHKTKMQRLNDYQRERYLQMHNFFIIRFTGSEVYVNAEQCANECCSIICKTLSHYGEYAKMVKRKNSKIKGAFNVRA